MWLYSYIQLETAGIETGVIKKKLFEEKVPSHRCLYDLQPSPSIDNLQGPVSEDQIFLIWKPIEYDPMRHNRLNSSKICWQNSWN